MKYRDREMDVMDMRDLRATPLGRAEPNMRDSIHKLVNNSMLDQTELERHCLIPCGAGNISWW